MNYEIENESSQNELLEYIYKNKSQLQNELGNVIIKRSRCGEETICVGFGEYDFKYKDFLIHINYHEEGNPKGDERIKYFKRLILSCEDGEKPLIDLTNELKDKNSNSLLNIYVTNEYGDWSLYNKIEQRKLDTIYIDQNIKQKLLDDINSFIKNEDEYNKFGIPYKKTFLLTGIPGSGKTSLIKSICNHFKLNLSILSVQKNFDNSALLNSIKRIEQNTILLIEDIDSFFEKRIGTDAPSITFSQFINVMDGVLYKHGIITFLTTNHPEKLDHALLRIGRIDKIIKIDYPAKINIQKLFIDMMKNDDDNGEGSKNTTFEEFYGMIKNQKITMSAIVNFLFRYRTNWKENIDELLLTNSFIKETTNVEQNLNLYS